MVIKADLDVIDLKILRELQEDGRMTNVDLSARVGISAPPCLRRVRKLEKAGIIRGYRAQLNAPSLARLGSLHALVGLKAPVGCQFRRSGENQRNGVVRETWMGCGESDFLLPLCWRAISPHISRFRHRGTDRHRQCRHGAHHCCDPPGQDEGLVGGSSGFSTLRPGPERRRRRPLMASASAATLEAVHARAATAVAIPHLPLRIGQDRHISSALASPDRLSGITRPCRAVAREFLEPSARRSPRKARPTPSPRAGRHAMPS